MELSDFLSQRARVGFWSPFLCAIILVGILYSPFASTETSITGFDEDDEDPDNRDKMMTTNYHFDIVSTTAPSIDMMGEEGEDYFGGQVEFAHEYGNGDDDDDEIADLAETLDGKVTWITYLVVFLLILQAVRIQREWTGTDKVNGHTATGATMLVIGLIAITGVFAVIGDLEDSFIYLEDEYDDFDSGLYGKAYTETEIGEDEIIAQTAWGPALGYWLLLCLAVIAFSGSVANLSTLAPDLKIEDKPKWGKSDSAPAFINNNVSLLGTSLMVLAIIAILTSIFTPWYNIDQSWEVSRMHVGEDPESEMAYNNTTHMISWDLYPFMVSFTNDSGIELVEEGEVTNSIESYSEHNELTNIAPVILQLRWPLICAGLLGAFFIMWRFWSKISQPLGGTVSGWSALMMLGIITVMTFGTGSFQDDMDRYAEDDLEVLTPNRNFSISNSDAKNSFAGASVTYDMDWGGGGAHTYFVQHHWNGGIGYLAASIAPWLIVSGFAIKSGPRFVEHLNEQTNPFDFDFDRSAWSARPTIAALICVLLLSAFGSGMGELVVDSKDAAPPGMYEWDVYVNNTWKQDNDYNSLDDGDTLTINFDTNDAVEGHATGLEFYIDCDDGVTAFTSDSPDTIEWSISAPEGVDTSGISTSGEIECNLQTVNEEYEGDYFIPEDGVYAESSQAVEDMIRWTNTGEGVWTLTLKANTNGGSGFAGDSDPALEYFYSIYAEIVTDVEITKEQNQ
jgi:hypothetical protein